METSKEILTELQEFAPLLGRTGISRIPYTVPVGYFEEFSEILMTRIRLGDSEITPKDEISSISPLLAGLQKKNPYQVPDDYFNTGKINIPSPETHLPKIIVIGKESSKSESIHYQQGTLHSEVRTVPMMSRIMRYAVAACLVGLLGITVYNLSNRNGSDPLHALTTVSDQDMANYLETDDIHWTPGLGPETASVEFSDNDIHALFSNVSDAELQDYSPSLPLEKGTVN